MSNLKFKSLEDQDINKMTIKAAMGQEEKFNTNVLNSLEEEYSKSRLFSTEKLIKILQDIKSSLTQRITAGQILALIGDPRINQFEPDMKKILGQEAQVGTELNTVDNLVKKYKKLGVRKEWLMKEVPRHSVNIKTFNLATYPITNIEYKYFLEETSYPEIPTSWNNGRFPFERSNHPVYTVSYKASIEYINWLNSKTQKNYRLPTEFEWEYAAAGPLKKEYPWGNEFDKNAVNTLEGGVFQTTSIGSYPRGINDFGNFDMAGNVEEYTSSDYSAYPNGIFVEDDLTLTLGKYKVAKGGSFLRFRDLTRNARRHGAYPGPLYAMGFRPAHD